MFYYYNTNLFQGGRERWEWVVVLVPLRRELDIRLTALAPPPARRFPPLCSNFIFITFIFSHLDHQLPRMTTMTTTMTTTNTDLELDDSLG